MNNFCKAVIVLSAFTAAAQSLTCHQCPIGIFSMCLFGDQVTCNNATQSCYHGEALFNSTDAFTLNTFGCLDSDLCGVTLTGDFFGYGYNTTFQCCTTNLCNGATSVRLPLTVALCAAILSSLWGMWDL